MSSAIGHVHNFIHERKQDIKRIKKDVKKISKGNLSDISDASKKSIAKSAKDQASGVTAFELPVDKNTSVRYEKLKSGEERVLLQFELFN